MSKQPITTFMFRLAHYHVSDDQGNEVLLKINYHENTFEIVLTDGQLKSRFKKNVEKIGTGLLARKHGQNFVERVLKEI